jgi:hypothetical protein
LNRWLPTCSDPDWPPKNTRWTLVYASTLTLGLVATTAPDCSRVIR